jgi:hypothetical protein
MNLPEVILAIVVIVMVARAVRDGRRANGDAAPAPTDDVRRMAEEIARLRERVQVLERVVTDERPAHDLSAQIDRLRDR